MDDMPGWMVFVMIGATLLNWLCRFIGLLILLWFGCRAVTAGYLAGDWDVFVRDVFVASIGWIFLNDVRITLGGLGMSRVSNFTASIAL